MDDQEIEEEIQRKLESAIEVIVARKLKQLADPNSAEVLAENIFNSMTFRNHMNEFFDNAVATRVGNRLRCGIYDSRAMDKAFDAIWDEQFDVAIRERIRERVRKAIDEEIRQRLILLQGNNQ